MKKIIYSLCAFALVFAFASCGSATSKVKDIAKKECECKKIKKEKRKAESEEAREKLQKKYDMCKYDLEIMESQFIIDYADKGDDTAFAGKVEKAYEEASEECNK